MMPPNAPSMPLMEEFGMRQHLWLKAKAPRCVGLHGLHGLLPAPPEQPIQHEPALVPRPGVQIAWTDGSQTHSNPLMWVWLLQRTTDIGEKVRLRLLGKRQSVFRSELLAVMRARMPPQQNC
eukprot:384436-Amphidinium_carterae.1